MSPRDVNMFVLGSLVFFFGIAVGISIIMFWALTAQIVDDRQAADQTDTQEGAQL